MPTYIPAKDALFASWSQNFSDVIEADPGLYGLQAADAVAIASVNDTFQAAYTLAIDPGTRTKVTVAAKDLARNQAKVLERSYAQIIQANVGVTQDAKTAAGLTVRDVTRTPIPAPATNPIAALAGGQPLNILIRWHDVNTPLSRAKPYGVMALEIYAATSATVISDPTMLPFKGLDTRNPLTITFSASDANKTAYMAFRYVTRRGLVGPWSPIIAGTVMGA
jgi:hypothetical protein